jgi:zona occludens toxin
VITIITGTPGAGKTLYTVSELLSKLGTRPLFVDGIPELSIPHLPFPGPVTDWHNWIPTGGAVVIDEAQRLLPVRRSSPDIPDHIRWLETHRHDGADIYLITQHPSFLDVHIRRLCDRHLHIRRIFTVNRALVYEWDHCSDPSSVKHAIKHLWAYPKKSFALYKSSTLHTKRLQSIPPIFGVLLIAFVLLALFVYIFWERIQERFYPSTATPLVAEEREPALPAPSTATKPVVEDNPDRDPFSWPESEIQRHPDYPASAPIYDVALQPVIPPVINGCVSSRKKCVCYSQQNTRLSVTDDFCRNYVANRYYDPHRQTMPEFAPVAGNKLAGNDTDKAPARDIEVNDSVEKTINPLAGLQGS